MLLICSGVSPILLCDCMVIQKMGKVKPIAYLSLRKYNVINIIWFGNF